MGRGDKKTFKGKITLGTFGNTRRRKHSGKHVAQPQGEATTGTESKKKSSVKKA